MALLRPWQCLVPHQISDPENHGEAHVRRMADVGKQTAEAARLVRERLI